MVNPQNSEQKPTTKNVAEFHNHLTLLAMSMMPRMKRGCLFALVILDISLLVFAVLIVFIIQTTLIAKGEKSTSYHQRKI